MPPYAIHSPHMDSTSLSPKQADGHSTSKLLPTTGFSRKVAPLGVSHGPPAHAWHRLCSLPLPPPVGRLLTGRTDDLILKAYARHHQAIRQVLWRARQLQLIPVHIKNRPTQATYRVVMVLRRPINPQAVPGAAHPATQPGADEHIQRLIDRGQGQGRMVAPERVIRDAPPWDACDPVPERPESPSVAPWP